MDSRISKKIDFFSARGRHAIFFLIALLMCCASEGKRGGSEAVDVLKNLNGEPVVPRESNRIIIPFFHNYTAGPSVAENLTLRLRKAVSMDGRLAVVSDNADADLRLSGSVVQYQIQPVQYGDSGDPVRKRLRVVASVRLHHLASDREIFYDGAVQAFDVFSELIPPVTSEIQVQDRVLESLAMRISVKVIEGWYTRLMTPLEKRKK